MYKAGYQLFWTSGKEEPDGPWKWTNMGRELSFTNWGRGWPKKKNKGALDLTQRKQVKRLKRRTGSATPFVKLNRPKSDSSANH